MFGRRRAQRDQRQETRSGASQADVSGTLSGMHARLSELAEREDQVARLVERFESQAGVAQRAVAEASKAREERDEYRRVLAASIASEHRSELRLEEVEQERAAAIERSREEAREAGAAGAERDVLRERLGALEKLVGEQEERHTQALSDLQDRAWTEREASRAELVKALARLGDETDQARRETAQLAGDVRAALAAHAVANDRELDRITDLRRRLLIGLGLGAAVLGIALTPPAILSAVDAERAYFVHMISDATLQLLGGAAVSFGLAVVLLTIARRDARRLATQG